MVWQRFHGCFLPKWMGWNERRTFHNWRDGIVFFLILNCKQFDIKPRLRTARVVSQLENHVINPLLTILICCINNGSRTTYLKGTNHANGGKLRLFPHWTQITALLTWTALEVTLLPPYCCILSPLRLSVIYIIYLAWLPGKTETWLGLSLKSLNGILPGYGGK